MQTVDRKIILYIKLEELFLEEIARQTHYKVTDTNTNQLILAGLEIIGMTLPATHDLDIDRLEILTESLLADYKFFKNEGIYVLAFGKNILEYVEYIVKHNPKVATVFEESYVTVRKLVKEEGINYGK